MANYNILMEKRVNKELVKKAVFDYLIAIGEDPNRDGLKNTPQRVADACDEMFFGMHQSAADVLLTRFKIDHNEMVLVKDIEVYSTCEHHLLPFHGVAHVAYIPDGKEITGLSKIARLVDVFARRLQVQEQLTSQIADAIADELNAKGVMVIIECKHLCMSSRGVKKSDSKTTTSAVRGVMRDITTRNEVLSLIHN